MLAGYFKKIGMRRFTVMAIGNLFLGMGISIFKLSGLGNDPFSGMVMALSDRTGITYALFLVMVNAVLFLYEITAGRKLIGAGTLINAFLLGYIVTFFYDIWLTFIDAGTDAPACHHGFNRGHHNQLWRFPVPIPKRRRGSL